ncbi:CinA family protein [Litoreibacter roseus]|uniref:Competence damage-inducible protein A n=1 Tax=Litoreibacter roseus TaxID=2601869 RepID=A0A6N6JLZ6_9RHOB|nr:CinA family protein [Litoreibacter roseus]GFE66890.1 competence damage-inducible protein A [Litoreibacter roseus]
MDFDARARDVLDAARTAGLTLATAESCTGGLITAALTEIAGSSDVVDRGFVTYSNAAKMQMLHVSSDTLETYGAVSEAVAQEMVEGAAKMSGASLCVSVTGIAGPGGSEHKPEGRVCFGCLGPKGLVLETVEFGAIGRSHVRAATVKHAFDMLLSQMISI